jgi:hypothetical protein
VLPGWVFGEKMLQVIEQAGGKPIFRRDISGDGGGDAKQTSTRRQVGT